MMAAGNVSKLVGVYSSKMNLEGEKEKAGSEIEQEKKRRDGR